MSAREIIDELPRLTASELFAIEQRILEIKRTEPRLKPPEIDPDRAAWLAQSERRLSETWGNGADDVFNELLT